MMYLLQSDNSSFLEKLLAEPKRLADSLHSILLPDDLSDTTVTCDNDGFFRHPSNCSRFYRCYRRQRFNFACGNGTYFDLKNFVCNWPYNVKCDNSSFHKKLLAEPKRLADSLDSILLPDNLSDIRVTCEIDGFFRHPSNCSRFYRCYRGQHFNFACGNGTYFDQMNIVCNWPYNVKCNNSSFHKKLLAEPKRLADSLDSILLPDDLSDTTVTCEIDGFFRHPSNCSRFYRCYRGQRFNFACGNGTSFDQMNLVCNWPNNVKCNL